MSVTKVRNYLKQYGLDSKVREFETSSATVQLAAEAAGVIPARIAKSISFMINDGAVLIVTAGDTKIDNHKFKETFGTKAKMLSPEEVIIYTGYEIGGVCPFDNPVNKLKVYLDESMKRFETVLPAVGSDNSCVELTLEELEKTSKFISWIDVCKIME